MDRSGLGRLGEESPVKVCPRVSCVPAGSGGHGMALAMALGMSFRGHGWRTDGLGTWAWEPSRKENIEPDKCDPRKRVGTPSEEEVQRPGPKAAATGWPDAGTEQLT